MDKKATKLAWGVVYNTTTKADAARELTVNRRSVANPLLDALAKDLRRRGIKPEGRSIKRKEHC